MASNFLRPDSGRGNAISLLDAAIEVLNLAKEISSIAPAKAVFGTTSALLVMIKVCFPILQC